MVSTTLFKQYFHIYGGGLYFYEFPSKKNENEAIFRKKKYTPETQSTSYLNNILIIKLVNKKCQ